MSPSVLTVDVKHCRPTGSLIFVCNRKYSALTLTIIQSLPPPNQHHMAMHMQIKCAHKLELLYLEVDTAAV